MIIYYIFTLQSVTNEAIQNYKLKLNIPKYQTGYYSISQLAKEYNISKSTLSKYIKENNIKINEHATQATNALNNGFSTLEKIINERGFQINEHLQNTQDKGVIDTQNNDLIECKNINTLIVKEVIEIVKQKKPLFCVYIPRFKR